MIAWPAPFIPAVPTSGERGDLRLHDSATGRVRPLEIDGTVGLYVCGITPYDATHLGHAATYVTFDVLGRVARDLGHPVRFVQNVTDIDDPLLERAERDGLDWQQLARLEIALFREDMTALAVIPPDHFLGVVESMETIVAAVRALVASGRTYAVRDPSGGPDVYLDLASTPSFGGVSDWTREEMLAIFADRGGDPDRVGKRDPLDPLLWRAARAGEPAWDGGSLGSGRPGWHIECTAIAGERLGFPFEIQGGGTDLVFPHHEMSAAQAEGLTGTPGYARHYVHQAMVGLHGEKMSKSKGNLVLVSALRAAGVDPMAIRLELLAQHYRTDWEHTDSLLALAEARLARWRAAVSVNAAPSADVTVATVREALRDDLDTPRALAAVDAWADASLAAAAGTAVGVASGGPAVGVASGGPDVGVAPGGPAVEVGGHREGSACSIGAPGVLARAVDALLGVRL